MLPLPTLRATAGVGGQVWRAGRSRQRTVMDDRLHPGRGVAEKFLTNRAGGIVARPCRLACSR